MVGGVPVSGQIRVSMHACGEDGMNEKRRTRGLRRIDAVALIGVVALSGGAALFKFGADYLPAWLAWLIAPLLWYSGFGLLVGWALARLVGTSRHSASSASPATNLRPLGAAAQAKEKAAGPLASNFIEHDSVLEQV